MGAIPHEIIHVRNFHLSWVPLIIFLIYKNKLNWNIIDIPLDFNRGLVILCQLSWMLKLGKKDLSMSCVDCVQETFFFFFLQKFYRSLIHDYWWGRDHHLTRCSLRRFGLDKFIVNERSPHFWTLDSMDVYDHDRWFVP